MQGIKSLESLDIHRRAFFSCMLGTIQSWVYFGLKLKLLSLSHQEAVDILCIFTWRTLLLILTYTSCNCPCKEKKWSIVRPSTQASWQYFPVYGWLDGRWISLDLIWTSSTVDRTRKSLSSAKPVLPRECIYSRLPYERFMVLDVPVQSKRWSPKGGEPKILEFWRRGTWFYWELLWYIVREFPLWTSFASLTLRGDQLQIFCPIWSWRKQSGGVQRL